MHFPLEPIPHCSVELLLFRRVSNASDLRARMVKGHFSAAFVRANLIVDVFQALVAASTALHREKEGTMSTRNVFTEIVYSLSGTRNITKALQRFSIADDTTDVLVLVPNPNPEHVEHIRNAVQGTEDGPIPERLREHSDMVEVRKIYGVSEQEESAGSLLDSVVTRMACRDIR